MVKMITSPTVPTKTRRRHPMLWYFALAYAISWPFWALSHLTGGTVGIGMIGIGGVGPRGAHPVLWFFDLPYALSWPFWALPRLTGGTVGIVMIVIGGFGPMLAAAV